MIYFFFFLRGGKIDGAIFLFFSFDRILVTISNDLTLMWQSMFRD